MRWYPLKAQGFVFVRALCCAGDLEFLENIERTEDDFLDKARKSLIEFNMGASKK